jgi:hypothetical protein
VKTYRRHNCGKRHVKWETAARCVWRTAEWVQAREPLPMARPVYALVARCGRVWTVTLWASLEAAQRCDQGIRFIGCGSRCPLDARADHEIVRLVPPQALAAGFPSCPPTRPGGGCSQYPGPGRAPAEARRRTLSSGSTGRLAVGL